MNEEFLRALHANMGGDKVGSFEEFKNEFQSNEEFQRAVHINIGGDKVGSFDEFKTELFGASTKTAPKATPSVRFSPKQEALLDSIADVEAPDYNVIVGGGKFEDFSKHPNIVGVTTKYGPSTAAGKYQFTKSTWDEVSKELDLNDFSPDSQRVAALYYAETRYKDLTGGRNIYQDIDDGKLENIRDVLGGAGGETVWQGLQGDTEFANRFKSHLGRYENLVKENEKELTPQQKLEESVKGFEGAVKKSGELTKDLRYDLGTTEIPQSVDKKLPKSLEETKDSLDAERKRLDEINRKYKQAHLTRQEELTKNFEETPVFQEMNQKYDAQYKAGYEKYIKDNVETNPEFTGFKQKIQDDLNRGLINQDEANKQLNDYIQEKASAAPELKDLGTQINKAFSDEYNSVFNGYVSKDNIISDLNSQVESIFGKSKSFQQELLNQYNAQVDEYNKSAKTAQSKGSKTVGLPGGGPYAQGKRPQDYTGGLTKANETSQDIQEKINKLPETTGFDKDAAISLWYKEQKRPMPTEKSKKIAEKANEYFAKGRELKLKQHEVLKEELFTIDPVELGRASIKDYNNKVQEYGDEQRGLYEQDKVAIKSYYDNYLAKFKETSDIKLSEKFGERYTDFNNEVAAIDTLKKSGKDVTAKVKSVQEDYKDILADDDYILANQGVSDLYKAAKFEEDQLADKYQQKERLSNIDKEQAWANNNPVISTLLNTVTKTIGGAGQMFGAVLEQAQKFNIPVPGFAILSGFAAKGAKELGEKARVAGGDLIESSQFTTKMQGQVNETFSTTPSGKRVVYDPDTGEPIYIRNEDGTMYEGFEADTIINSAKGLKKETAINPFSGLGQALDIAAYMIPTIVASYGSAGAASAIGLGATGINVASKIGMFMGGFGQSYSDVKQEALKQRNIDLDEVEVLAGLAGIANGVIENFNPIEGKMFTKRIPKNIINENIVNMASGRVSKMDIFNSLAKGGLNVIGGGAKETFLEELPQTVTENAFKNYYNANKGTEFNTNVSTDQWYDIIIMSMGMGMLGDGIRNGRGSNLGKKSLSTIVNNREMYDAFISGMEKTDPERAAKLRSDIEPLLTEIDAIDGLTPSRKEKSIELLYDIKAKETKLASITEPTLRKPVEDQLIKLRKELGDVTQVKTDEKGEPIEDTEETITKTTKPKENAVQEQKTTEVPVQPKAEGSRTDTQGQPQPKPEGTAQQGKAQETKEVTPEEFDDVEIVADYSETPVTYKGESGILRKDGQTWTVETPTTIYDLNEVGDNTTLSAAGIQIADKITPNEDGSFSIRGKEYSNIFSDPMSAITLNEDGSYTVRLDTKGDNPKPRNFRGQIAEDLAYQITLQKITKEDAKGFEEYINNADANGEIPSPVSETKVGTDAEVPKAKKQRVRSAPESTISSEQGVPTTQGEKVSPTQPQEAQNSNVLTDFEVTTTKGTAAPRTYTKNSNGKWIAQTKKEDGTLSKGVPVSSANVVAQLDSESSKRAAESTPQDVEGKKSDIEKRRQEELNAFKDREIESVKKSTKGTPIISGNVNGTKVGDKFNEGLKVIVQDSQTDDNFDPAIADNDGDGYTIIDRVVDYGEMKDGKMSKAPTLRLRVFNNKADADAYLEKQRQKFDNQIGKSRQYDKINAKYDAELAAIGQQPAAQTPTTKTKDKETTTIPNPIKTELENIGKTPKQIQEQIYKFFTSKIPGLPEDKARDLAVSTYVMWDSIGRTLGGAKGIDFIQKKLAQIGQISTAKEAERMAKDAGGSVKFQDADPSLIAIEAEKINNAAITHLTELIERGDKMAAAEKDPAKKKEIQDSVKSFKQSKILLERARKDPKFSVDAYHGTPYIFDKFTTEKIGTGEGAQAFGWGLYFTDVKSIANYYATKLARREVYSNDKKLNDLVSKWQHLISVDGNRVSTKDVDYMLGDNVDTLNRTIEELKNFKPDDRWKRMLKRNLLNDIESLENNISLYERVLSNPDVSGQDYVDNLKITLDNYKFNLADLNNSLNNFDKYVKEEIEIEKDNIRSRIKDLRNVDKELGYISRNEDKLLVKKDRNVYTVSLHEGKTPDQYNWLEWDKPVNENQLAKIKVELNRTNIDEKSQPYIYSTKDKIISAISELPADKGGRNVYDLLETVLGSPKAASDFLLRAGIDGIKYPAESISRGATSDTARGSNYVVFDENAVTIKERIQFQQDAANIKNYIEKNFDNIVNFLKIKVVPC